MIAIRSYRCKFLSRRVARYYTLYTQNIAVKDLECQLASIDRRHRVSSLSASDVFLIDRTLTEDFACSNILIDLLQT